MNAPIPVVELTADVAERLAWYDQQIDEAIEAGDTQEQKDHNAEEVMRHLVLTDLFYLLAVICARDDVKKTWLMERCDEVQEDPDERLDLWSREHYKSTIITFAKTIQDILRNPDITVGIFSHTKPIAKAFLRQIKYELETNETLQKLFPDILWTNPKSEAVQAGCQWSEDKGITVKRKTNPKESTVEANGLVDGMPTSKHYSLLVYDDVVTKESVTSPDMIKKTTDSLALSYNLGAHGGVRRFIGTRYHYNDTYATLIKRGTAVTRIHPATKNGEADGEPVFLTREQLAKKLRDMGSYVFGCQMLQNPTADRSQGFKIAWKRTYVDPPQNRKGLMNVYLLVDPANEKRQHNDYTSMFVIGCAADQNYYWLDGTRDRLNLTERTAELFRLQQLWMPRLVGYEKYGMQADIQHIEYVQNEHGYRFKIIPLGGQTPKNDRIKRLQPIFEAGRFWTPQHMVRRLNDGSSVDLVEVFFSEEFEAFPVMAHDDMLDCCARIDDPEFNVMFPKPRHAAVQPKVIRGMTR